MKTSWLTRTLIVITLPLLSAVSSCDVPQPVPLDPPESARAKILVEASTTRHRVSPLLFGMHIEWVENGLGLIDAESGRLRSGVVDALRPLKIPLFRFPGGIHADYYNWRLGIGERQTRGQSRNVFTGQTESHYFGSPEFAGLLEEVGAEALITANFGTGTAAEAGAWAGYLKKRGVAAPLWEVGNEIYLADPDGDGPNGRAIYRTPQDYAAAFPRYREAIREQIPEARVGAILHFDTGAFDLAPPAIRSWSEDMLSALDSRADFVAVHNAYAPVILDDSIDFADPRARREAYRAVYAAAEQTADNLETVAARVAALSPVNREAPIAITEFGPFFGLSSDRDIHAQYVDQTRTMAAALYVASILDVMIDNPRVFMACYTNPIHRWYGGLLTDTPEGLVKTPTYHLYRLYRERFESRLVETVVDSPQTSAPAVGIVRARPGIPDLIAKASLSADRSRLTMMIVNRSVNRSLTTRVDLVDFVPAQVDCQIVSAPSPAALNGAAVSKSTISGDAIRPRDFPCPDQAPLTLEIPPNSILSLVAGAQSDLRNGASEALAAAQNAQSSEDDLEVEAE